MEIMTIGLLWFAAISVGMMAGVYFSFSAFIMRSLDLLEEPSGMLAMRSINREILKSAFLPLFFASTLACVVLAVVALLDLSAAGAGAMLTGCAAYVVGMFIVTVVGNVPLNNALESTPAEGAVGEATWRRYMQRWVFWNHVRTASCTLSSVMLVAALVQRA